MNRRLLIIPAAVAATLGLTVTSASANAFGADADCRGLVFNMDRTEDGTQVRTYRNGVLVRTDDVTVFGTPVRFTLPSPDQTVAQAWRVEVDSRWNADQVFTETVAACVAATSVPSSTVTPTTAAPSPSTTVPETTVVAVTTPPVVPSTTVVNPPRTTTTTTAAPTTTTVGSPPVFELPATGGRVGGQATVAGVLCAVGAAALVAARRRAVRS